MDKVLFAASALVVGVIIGRLFIAFMEKANAKVLEKFHREFRDC